MQNTIIADTPEAIERFQFLAIKSALKLEILGMKKRGPSAFSIAKSKYGFKGSKQSVFDQMQAIVDKTIKENETLSVQSVIDNTNAVA